MDFDYSGNLSLAMIHFMFKIGNQDMVCDIKYMLMNFSYVLVPLQEVEFFHANDANAGPLHLYNKVNIHFSQHHPSCFDNFG